MEIISGKLQKFINLSIKVLKIIIFLILFFFTFLGDLTLKAQNNDSEKTLENIKIEESSSQKIKAEINPEIEDIFLENISLPLMELTYRGKHDLDIFSFDSPLNHFYIKSSYTFDKFYDLDFLFTDIIDKFYFTLFFNIGNFYFLESDLFNRIFLDFELFYNVNSPFYFDLTTKNYYLEYNYSNESLKTEKKYIFRLFSMNIVSIYRIQNLVIKLYDNLNYNYFNTANYFDLDAIYTMEPLSFKGFFKLYNINNIITGIGIKGGIKFNEYLYTNFYFYPVFYNNFDLTGKLEFDFKYKNFALNLFFKKQIDFNDKYFDMLPVFDYAPFFENTIDISESYYDLNFSCNYFYNFSLKFNKREIQSNFEISFNLLYSYIEKKIFIISKESDINVSFEQFKNINYIKFNTDINLKLNKDIKILTGEIINLYFDKCALIKTFYTEPFKIYISMNYDLEKIKSLFYISYKGSFFRYDNTGKLDPIHIIEIKIDYYGINKINYASFKMSIPVIPLYYTRYFFVSQPEFKLEASIIF